MRTPATHLAWPSLLAAVALVGMGANDDAGCGRGAAPTPGVTDATVGGADAGAVDDATTPGADLSGPSEDDAHAGLRCETASDCEAAGLTHPACDGGWTCVDNACGWRCDEGPEPEPSGCYGDAQCPPDLRCNAAEVCFPPPGCEAGEACPDVCYGQCVPREAPSELCQDSGACPAGTHCSTEDGECLSACPPGEACATVCSGRCVPDREPPGPVGTCSSDADCTDGLVCNAAEVCRPAPGCADGEVCDSACYGECVPPTPPPTEMCTGSEQCGPNEHCSTEDGECLSPCPPGETCVTVCAGRCVPDPVCFNDAGCALNEFCDFGACGGSPAAIVACAGTCMPRPRCGDSAECRDGEVCACAPPGFSLPAGLIACEMMCLPKGAECFSDRECGFGRACEAFACVDRPVQCWGAHECPDTWSCVPDCSQLPPSPDPGARMVCPSYCEPPTEPGPACGVDGLTCPEGTVCGCDPSADAATCIPACLPVDPALPAPWECARDTDCVDGELCRVVVCADPYCDAAGNCTGGGCFGTCEPPYDCKQDSDCGRGSCLFDQMTCAPAPDGSGELCKGWCQAAPPTRCADDCDCPLDAMCYRGEDGGGRCRHIGMRNQCRHIGCQSDDMCADGEQCLIACPSCMPGALCPPCQGSCVASR
jgi:hypothetical protein